MYHLIRKIHLYAGLIIATFLTMYFVSGYTMAHRPWFLPPSPPATTRTVTLDADRPGHRLPRGELCLRDRDDARFHLRPMTTRSTK
ncbi:MAG TPA: hypothetical protein VGI81_01080 [Tepidisphaeraceae bacterium]|jgi:hypothetical protein